MNRVAPLVSLAAGVLFFAAVIALARLERGGPVHAELFLEGGVPATFYLPDPPGGDFRRLEPPPRGERPPAVVLAHGIAGDRAGVSGLARGLSRNGYAVLAVDLAGHGANRNPFPGSRTRSDAFRSDVAAAVDFLRGTPYVDGHRIALMGHSTGAGAVLDFATRDSGIDAVVPISGGRGRMLGPFPPANALFIYAEGDPERVRTRATQLAAALAGVDRVEPGRLYGDHAAGTAVRAVEVPGTGHVLIVWSAQALAEMVDWLDAVFDFERRELRGGSDPRLWPLLAVVLSWLVLLPSVGLLVGRLVPADADAPGFRAVTGLGVLAAALVAATPLVALGAPASVLPLEVGDVLVGLLSLAGVAALVGLRLRGLLGPAPLFARFGATLVGALVGCVAVYVLLSPLGTVVHRLAPTPERLAVGLGAWALLFPFALSFQLLVRRGSPLRAAGFAVTGRVVVLASLYLGVALGILPRVVNLMLPSLLVVSILVELVAAGVYARSRNRLAIALIEAFWLAWIFAATMPIRV